MTGLSDLLNSIADRLTDNERRIAALERAEERRVRERQKQSVALVELKIAVEADAHRNEEE